MLLHKVLCTKDCLTFNAGSVQNYTAEDFEALFEDANLTLAQEIGPPLIGNLSAKTAFPGTNFYGFYGSGAHAVQSLLLA